MRNKHTVSPTPPMARIALNKRRATSEANSSRRRREVVARGPGRTNGGQMCSYLSYQGTNVVRLDADWRCLSSRTAERACNTVLRDPRNGEARVLMVLPRATQKSIADFGIPSVSASKRRSRSSFESAEWETHIEKSESGSSTHRRQIRCTYMRTCLTTILNMK